MSQICLAVRALAVVVSMMCVSSARADILGGMVTGGSTSGNFELLITAPAEVGNNNVNSPNLLAFAEQQEIVIPAPLPGGGPFPPVPAGTSVSSYLVFFDPAAPSTVAGFVVFDEPILRIIGDAMGLNASEAMFGLSSVDYQIGPASGLEMGPGGQGDGPGDMVRVDPLNRRRLLFTAGASNPGDHVRVLTGRPVPEPTSLACLAAAVTLCAVGVCSSKRRA